MRKSNKKGFTIVELVIVIAAIAVVVAALIFIVGTIKRANNEKILAEEIANARLLAEANAKEAAAQQNAKNLWTDYLSSHAAALGLVYGYIEVEGSYFLIEKGEIHYTVYKVAPTAPIADGKLTDAPDGYEWKAVEQLADTCTVHTNCTDYFGLYIWTLSAAR